MQITSEARIMVNIGTVFGRVAFIGLGYQCLEDVFIQA